MVTQNSVAQELQSKGLEMTIGTLLLFLAVDSLRVILLEFKIQLCTEVIANPGRL